jgi:hypothetical protein
MPNLPPELQRKERDFSIEFTKLAHRWERIDPGTNYSRAQKSSRFECGWDEELEGIGVL